MTRTPRMTPKSSNITFDRTAGLHSLASAGQRERSPHHLQAAALGAESPPAERIYRIGLLQKAPRVQQLHLIRALEESLQDLGYVTGRNLVTEYRFADGVPERLPSLAAALVRLKVDVIVTGSSINTVAARQVTSTIPIVMAAGTAAVEHGLVASLARPGGNVTGLTIDVGPEVSNR